MPGFNKTGPAGTGSITGRQLGKCKGDVENFPEKGYRNFSHRFRGGFGRGRGRGLGFRRGNLFGFHEDVFPDISDETLLEKEAYTLKDQLLHVEKELERFRKEKREE